VITNFWAKLFESELRYGSSLLGKVNPRYPGLNELKFFRAINMRQVVQKLQNGQLQVIEVPIPPVQKGFLLIQNHYSLISAGTESSTVKTARKGYIGKAKERPQQVKKVVDVLKSQGPVQAYRAVTKKLASYSPLGYCCAGEVIGVPSDAAGYAIGDLVACGGVGLASHAEIVSVPTNLCVKLEKDANLAQAAYITLGAIALQGFRQADIRLGENCAVIGLGLLGQLTALILKAAGMRVIGIDVDSTMVDVGAKHCLDLALNREQPGIEDLIFNFTGGIGCDAAIITAASDSLDPINLAGAVSRKKGTIVVVGDVPTGFDREPHFYKKELQVKMSCSYGPGRYDPVYEEKGVDYPIAYVRWTENRNMQAFQNLIYSKRIDVSYLTTHTFNLEEAPAAYDMILAQSEPYLGILIEYNATKKVDFENRKISIKPPTSSLQPSSVCIGFIGAGSYAQSHLLPNIPKNLNITCKAIMTKTGINSRSVAERYGFDFCTTHEKDVIQNDEIDTVFILTRHDSHAYYVTKALNAGKHVFVEKPLCLKIEELEDIRKCYELSNSSCQQLLVGYNRRFSPFIQKIRKELGEGPLAMSYRVNAGAIPKESWIQDLEFGGGRVIGEVCHFVDTLTFLCGSLPVSVYANAMADPSNNNDTINVTLTYENGSVGTIAYFANGDKSLPKERIEVFSHGAVAIVDDFRKLTVYTNGKKNRKTLLSQDKGQKEEIRQFFQAILNGVAELIPFKEIYNTSLVTFKINDSIQSGERIQI
jgi:predicted dehydrogenase/threonine dehydrogenase-like Zn-dependent dehydrogenase